MDRVEMSANENNNYREHEVAKMPSLFSFVKLSWLITALFVVQLLALVTVNYREFLHFGLTIDYAYFEQTFWLLAHGHLNPYPSSMNMSFWRNHFELLMWPLALLYWLWPQGPVLLIIQDIAAVAAEWFAFKIIQRIVQNSSVPLLWEQILTFCAAVILTFNPWVWWAESFDFHFHAIEACLVTAGLWAFFENRVKWGYILMILTLLASQVSTTYLIPAGVTMFFMGRVRRRHGFIIALLGLAWFLMTEHLGVNGLAVVSSGHGSSASSVSGSHLPRAAGGLIAIMLHPLSMVRAVAGVWKNILANLGPVGYLGLLSPWGLVPLLVIVETALAGGPLFTQPSDNTIAMWALVLIGTIIWINRVYLWSRWMGYLTLGLLLVNFTGWAIMGYGVLPTKYTMTSEATAQTLSDALRSIPANAEVVASQGILGRVATRDYVYSFNAPGVPIVSTKPIYFVISPYQGINVLSAPTIAWRLQYVVDNLHAKVVLHRHHIWILRWLPPLRIRSLSWPNRPAHLMAWTFKSAIGHAALQGRPEEWHINAGGTSRGYVLNGDYWRLAPGSYQATVSLQSAGPVNVEVWNDTGNVLLSRQSVLATHRRKTLTVPFVVDHLFLRKVYSGFGPFRYQPVISTRENNIEVRVWTPGGAPVKVYEVGVQTQRPGGG